MTNRLMSVVLILFLAGTFPVPVHAQPQSELPAYQRGENLLVNGDLKQLDRHGVPVGWEKLVIDRSTPATVQVDGQGVLHIVFHSPEKMFQARLKQTLQVEPGRVYEVTYDYRSEEHVDFRADTSLLGTGPQYRNIFHPPSVEWITRRHLFHIPPDVQGKGQVLIMPQNRSMVPIWYRNFSWRATDLKPEDVPNYEPPLAVHSLTSDDVLVMPDSQAEFLEFVIRSDHPEALARLHPEPMLLTPDGGVHRGTYENGVIRIPARHLVSGTSNLHVGFFDKPAGEKDRVMVSAARRIEIEKVAVEQIPTDLDFGQHAVFRRPDGTPFFPIGMYAGTGWGFSLKEFKDAGFNTVHTYGTDSWRIREENFKLLDEAHALGIWIMMGLPPRYMRTTETLTDLEAWVKAYRDYPAILFYYSDETYLMRKVPPSVIRRAHATVHRADPNRPHYAYERPDEKLVGCFDGIMFQFSSQSLGDLTKIRMGSQMPIFHVFGHADDHGTQSPSLEAIEYDFVMPVIFGARGVFYWIYRAIQSTNTEGLLLKERLYQVSSRFAPVAQTIVSEEANPAWTEAIRTDGAARHWVVTEGDRTLVFAGTPRNAQGLGELVCEWPSGVTVRNVLAEEAVDAQAAYRQAFEPGQVILLEVTASAGSR